VLAKWKAYLEEHAGSWGLPARGEWHPLYLNDLFAPVSATTPASPVVVVLWFHNREKFPSAACKVSRDEGILRREFGHLTEAWSRAPEHVPRPFACEYQAGFCMLWMAASPGRQLPIDRPLPASKLDSIVDLLLSIHQAGGHQTDGPAVRRHMRMVVEPLESITRFADSRLVRDGCATLLRQTSIEWLAALPVMPQHGDFALCNLLWHDRWRAVDWENYGAVDLPFYDLYTLVFSLVGVPGKLSHEWDPDRARNMPGLFGRYARGLGLPVSVARLVLPLTLANWFHALQHAERHYNAQLMAALHRAATDYFGNQAAWEQRLLPA